MSEILYDVALSYASEDRAFVREVAAHLRERKIVVYFDEYSQAVMLGSNLGEKLTEVYETASRFVAVFASEHYVNKGWTMFELERGRTAARVAGRKYVLTVQLDGAKLPGVEDSAVYLDFRSEDRRTHDGAADVARTIAETLSLYRKARPILLRRSLHQRLLDLSWQATLAGGVLAGLALILWSMLLGVLDLTYPSNGDNARQVGYGVAVNWSLTYAVLFPIAAAVLVATLEQVDCLFENLDKRGMFRTEIWARPDTPGAALRTVWLRGTRWRRIALVVVGILFPAGFALGEWFPNNFVRLYSLAPAWRPLGLRAPAAEVNDIDWGLACDFVHCSTLGRLSNAGLDFFAFFAEGFYISILLIFLVYAIDFARVLGNQSRQEFGIELWPVLPDKDPRCGFQEFEPLLNRMLLVVLVGYIMAYCVRLENLYLTSAKGHVPPLSSIATANPDSARAFRLPVVDTVSARSLGEFVSRDFLYTLNGAGEDHSLRGIASRLGQVEGRTRQTWMSGIGAFALYLVAIGIVLTTIGSLARRARANADRHYRALANASPADASAAAKLAQVAKMDVWPIGWVRFNTLLAWTLIALVSLIWYRVGAVIVAATSTYLVLLVAKAALARPAPTPEVEA